MIPAALLALVLASDPRPPFESVGEFLDSLGEPIPSL